MASCLSGSLTDGQTKTLLIKINSDNTKELVIFSNGGAKNSPSGKTKS